MSGNGSSEIQAGLIMQADLSWTHAGLGLHRDDPVMSMPDLSGTHAGLSVVPGQAPATYCGDAETEC